MNPVELGQYNDTYLHDGMARGDTLWGSAIYNGQLQAIDVSDPTDPKLVGSASTPSQFTHNAWVSDDGTHVFTTDEVGGGYIGSFDVTDLENIVEVDRIQSSPLLRGNPTQRSRPQRLHRHLLLRRWCNHTRRQPSAQPGGGRQLRHFT